MCACELLACGVCVCACVRAYVCVCVFLQARSNVLTGKYPCTVEEAITLEGLSMQVCL